MNTTVQLAESPQPPRQKDKPKINFLLVNMWGRYTLALLLIAGLTTSAFFIMSDLLKINEKSGAIVNVSGRQRMLSQRGALLALRLIAEQNPVIKAHVRDELTQMTELMLKSHEGLVKGSEEMDLPSTMSAVLKQSCFVLTVRSR